MENEMVTIKEIAKYLRISIPTAYKLANSGSFPVVKVGCRYIIPRLPFEHWVMTNASGGNQHEE